TWRSTAAASL
ncbi:flagellar hook-basal body family protein, partial [Vibrio parahaemolyticus V-223/04]